MKLTLGLKLMVAFATIYTWFTFIVASRNYYKKYGQK